MAALWGGGGSHATGKRPGQPPPTLGIPSTPQERKLLPSPWRSQGYSHGEISKQTCPRWVRCRRLWTADATATSPGHKAATGLQRASASGLPCSRTTRDETLSCCVVARRSARHPHSSSAHMDVPHKARNVNSRTCIRAEAPWRRWGTRPLERTCARRWRSECLVLMQKEVGLLARTRCTPAEAPPR